MKKQIIFVLLSLIFNQCSVENKPLRSDLPNSDLDFINDYSIEYAVVLKSCDTCVPISSVGYRVLLNLSDDQLMAIDNIDNSEWIKLLSKNNSDWATNLILYWKYDRSAHLFAFKKNRREYWEKYLRQQDIEYWNETFNNN